MRSLFSSVQPVVPVALLRLVSGVVAAIQSSFRGPGTAVPIFAFGSPYVKCNVATPSARYLAQPRERPKCAKTAAFRQWSLTTKLLPLGGLVSRHFCASPAFSRGFAQRRNALSRCGSIPHFFSIGWRQILS